MKILSVFGTRPEAIKMAPVLSELAKHPETFESIVCITAQHRDLLDEVLAIFNIEPNIDLNLMSPNQSLDELTQKILMSVTKVIDDIKPDLILVHGDTTTCLATSLAAYYAKIPLGHVEAGLRTGNKFAPFPEELNRELTDRMADFLFAPTEQAKKNLLNEGIAPEKITLTGNTIVDAVHWAVEMTNDISIPFSQELENKRLMLVTTHRRESFGEGIENICHAIKKVATSHPDLLIIFPIHPNPNVKQPVQTILQHSNIKLCDPLDYLTFIDLLRKATIVLTDSGGIQEEAVSLNIPLLVAREVTERPEVLDFPHAYLVGTDKDNIYQRVKYLLDEKNTFEKHDTKIKNPFGEGEAARKIIEFLILENRH